jgi:hypothetical protein
MRTSTRWVLNDKHVSNMQRRRAASAGAAIVKAVARVERLVKATQLAIESHARLAFPLFFGFVMVSGNHSFALESLSESAGGFSTLSTRGDRSSKLEPSWSRCIFSARAAASAISSGLTSSPLRSRAAISGVTRICLTFV